MKKVKLLILAALAVMMSATSFAADSDFPARPDTAIFVNDFAGVLRQSKVIDDSLRAFSKRTTNQIMVITVKDLGDYEPKMYAAELGDRWGIGQAKLDNGLIILIKPKTRDSKGQFALCPGRGLGGALPDVTCKRIVDSKAIPALKKGDYDAAVWAVLKAVMPICAGEISGDEATKKIVGRRRWLDLVCGHHCRCSGRCGVCQQAREAKTGTYRSQRNPRRACRTLGSSREAQKRA